MLALGVVFLGIAHFGNAVVASILLVLGITVLTAGENLHSTTSWQVSYDLSPAELQGRYLSVFNTGTNGQFMVGPAIVTAVGVTGGVVGWIGIAGIFLLSGEASRRCTSWIQHSRAVSQVEAVEVPG